MTQEKTDQNMTVADLQATPVAGNGLETGSPSFGPAPLAFELFYAQHRDSVGRMISLTLNDDSLGFEAADEAMARAYERWTTVAGYTNPEGWVYRTGLNWARSFLRRRKRGKTKDRLTALPSSIESRPADADLRRALATLNDDQRAVVVLRFYRDWTVEQTAEALGIAPGTVKSRLSRALQQLNSQLTR
ncbi:MAG: RNA polymerase sigma factor (sigma-70 family) [Acidimicrobiales bacterium]|jgi:RNA polymerase sigma factor (sigma-70 family)